ncbi:MAG: diguanylate cyclase [Methyloprofundus sp.]|nr:diguanylate cyclase [Methyloprofundus sp.]MBW6452477.1 diguanylate cyclase [Methyloprofundus sp.]
MGNSKYAIFLPIILFIVFDISALSLNYWISDSLSKSALAINLAGRQRMLTQRISKSLLLVKLSPTDTEKQTAQDELKAALHLFDSTLKAFKEGGNTLDGDYKPVFITAIESSQARQHLEQGLQLWTTLKPSILLSLDSPTATPALLNQAIENTSRKNLALLQKMNQLTLTLEQEANKQIRLLRVLQSLLIIMALVNFFYITQRLVKDRRLASKNNQTLNTIFNSIETSIIIYSKSRKIIFSNQAANQLFQYPDGIPKNLLVNNLLTFHKSFPIGHTRSGTAFPVKIECQKNAFRGIPCVICTIDDATKQIKKEENLRKIAFHDPLTGLANRLLFHERLTQEILHNKRHLKALAVLFIDLDGFKAVNDELGHDAGDQLLKLVSQRLIQCCREEDTVARMGGDEFTLILSSITNIKAAERIASTILQQLSNSFLIQNQIIHITASIGISLYPKDHYEADLLIKYADNAMYEAKKSGKNRYALASNQLNKTTQQPSP